MTTMTRWLAYLLGVGLMLATSTAMASALQWTHAKHWEQHCAQLQDRFAKSPVTDVTITPLPKLPASDAPVWKLNWHGLAVPIPALPYTHIAIMGDHHAVLLATDNQQYVHIGFALALAMPDPTPKFIQSLWGDDTSMLDFLVFEYTVTPDDLSCTKEHLRQQARTAMALILKTTAGPADFVAAHRIPGWTTGLLKYGHTGEGLGIHDYLLKGKAREMPSHVRYALTEHHTNQRRAALLLARPGKADFTQGPEWLRQLQKWLNHPSDSRLCNLTDALRQAGFDADDIRSLTAHAANSCKANE